MISERTYVIYSNVVFTIKKNLPNVPIQLIQIQDIENLSDNIREFSNETITKIWNSLKLAYRIATNRRIVKYNLMLDEMLIKPNSARPLNKVEALTIKEQAKLIRILNRELKKDNSEKSLIYASLLCLYTGMRIGEALALKQDSIDLENNILTVSRTLTTDTVGRIYLSNHTKTYKSGKNVDKGRRAFSMVPKVRTIIRKLLVNSNLNNNDFLFWNYKKNSFISTNDVNRYLQKINQKYGITKGRLHSHILRHTFITRCVESGMNLKIIQYLVRPHKHKQTYS